MLLMFCGPAAMIGVKRLQRVAFDIVWTGCNDRPFKECSDMGLIFCGQAAMIGC